MLFANRELFIETNGDRIKRYSKLYKNTAVTSQYKSFAEKFNLDAGLKGYVSKADMTQRAYTLRMRYAKDAYERIYENMKYLQQATGIESFACFGFPFMRSADEDFFLNYKYLGTGMFSNFISCNEQYAVVNSLMIISRDRSSLLEALSRFERCPAIQGSSEKV